MTKKEARRIGGRKGMVSAATGLIIAYLIMAFFMLSAGLVKALFWIVDVEYKFNLFVGGIIMLLSCRLWGQLAGIGILMNKKNYLLVGILCGIGALMTAAFLSGLPGFIMEGMPWKYSVREGFEAYVVKPFFWITIFGFVPAAVVGAWMGWSIRQYQRSESTES